MPDNQKKNNLRVYKTRFAPSPTGLMHLGHVSTHLLIWLRARKNQGKIVMRFEDLAWMRVQNESADQFLYDHEWLGFDFDEGPYFQSERKEDYQKVFDELKERNMLYSCDCSRKDLEDIGAPHGDLGLIYPGTCRHKKEKDVEKEMAYRFKMPELDIRFVDKLYGEQSFKSSGDFIIQRKDKIWAYQLAVVVDDINMGISEVIRGNDLLSSTPRQIALYESLNHSLPSFFHTPLVFDHEDRRLSKRNKSLTLSFLRKKGLSKEKILGFLAYSLGIIPEKKDSSLEEILDQFDINKINQKGFSLKLFNFFK